MKAELTGGQRDVHGAVDHRLQVSRGPGERLAQMRDDDRANRGRWMDEERAAFVDLVRRDIDPDGLFRRGVWPPR
jgi:hypothetical protein